MTQEDIELLHLTKYYRYIAELYNLGVDHCDLFDMATACKIHWDNYCANNWVSIAAYDESEDVFDEIEGLIELASKQ